MYHIALSFFRPIDEIHVISIGNAYTEMAGGAMITDSIRKNLQKESRKQLAETLAYYPKKTMQYNSKLKVTTHAKLASHPGKAICDFIEELSTSTEQEEGGSSSGALQKQPTPVDFVVVGQRSKPLTAHAKVLIGSTSRYVQENVNAHLIVLKPDIAQGSGALKLKRTVSQDTRSLEAIQARKKAARALLEKEAKRAQMRESSPVGFAEVDPTTLLYGNDDEAANDGRISVDS